MKKRLVTGMLMIGVLMLAGCGGAANEDGTPDGSKTENIQAETESIQTDTMEEDTSEASEENEEAVKTDQTDMLVVYFSRTGEQYNVGVIDKGNTAIAAEMIAEQTGADTFEILPADDIYPMTYDELTDVAKQEQNENARPEIAGEIPDLSQYDTIFIGAPVWWGDWPMIMYTFFEENEDALAGKTLVPFSTHAGSGLSGFDRKLEAACPQSSVGTGLAIAGIDAQQNRDGVRQSINDWLAELGY